MHDIAIVGAGPAGATLARLLGDRYRVLLVDRRPLDRPFAPGMPLKSCGGLVAPDAQKAMAELGLGLPSGVVVGPQLFAVRTLDLQAGRERYYQRFYINIDRERFDRWLASLARFADLRPGCGCTRVDRRDAGFALHLVHDGTTTVEEARLVVGADGAGSVLRRLAAPDAPAPRRYVAIQQWFEAPHPQPYFSAVFDARITDFYSWTIPKEDRLLVGAALAPGDGAHARFDQLKERLGRVGFDLSRPLAKEGSLLVRPVSGDQVSLGGRGIALIGEAAGFISPSSAEGLSYAFRSALALALALEPGIEGWETRYRRAAGGLRRKLLGKNLKSPAMYQPTLRRWVMASGIESLAMHPGP